MPTSAAVDLVAPPSENVLSEGDLWRIIEPCEDTAVLDEWRAFGTLLLTELQSRSAALDSKATTLAGWSIGTAAAGLAFTAGSAIAYVVVVPALAATVLSCLALHVRAATLPSQMDWFSQRHSCDSRQLKRFHLLSMRDWHEGDADMNRHKAGLLKWAQGVMGVAAFALLGLLASGATLVTTR